MSDGASRPVVAIAVAVIGALGVVIAALIGIPRQPPPPPPPPPSSIQPTTVKDESPSAEPTPSPSVYITPDFVPWGQMWDLNGTGFPVGAYVAIHINGSHMGYITVNSSGSFRQRFYPPEYYCVAGGTISVEAVMDKGVVANTALQCQ